MKAVSLWQPWASGMALGAKTNETRHWPTNYRGPMAIHAAKRMLKVEMIYLRSCRHWGGVFMPVLPPPSITPLWEVLPFGAIIAVGELVDCRPTTSIPPGELDAKRFRPEDTDKLYGWTERDMGNYEPGRFAWVFENIRALPSPIPFIGRQGLFDVPDELIGNVPQGKAQAALFE